MRKLNEDERGAGRKAKKYLREREVVCWLAEFVIAAGSGGGFEDGVEANKGRGASR